MTTIQIRAVRAGVAALAVSTVLSSCSVAVGGTARPASGPPPLLKPNQIEALLPTAEQTAQVVDGPHIEIGAAIRAIKEFPFQISDPNCFASISEATEPAYRDSGYGPVRGLILTEPGDLHAREHLVGEAVVLYHTPLEADKLVSRTVEQWSRCANKTLTEYPSGMTPQNWPLGSPDVVDDVHTVFNSQEAAGGWGCSRAITSRRNLVIDVRVCSKAGEAALKNQAAALVHTTAAKIRF